MASPAPEPHGPDASPLVRLGPQERAVLAVLVANRGRVVARRDLAMRAGMANLSERRCDSALVGLRRALGPEAILTVRSRGWRLHEDAFALAVRLLEEDHEHLGSTG